MGIERARVVEVHSGTSVTGRVGSGYQISDRLVLTHGGIVARTGPTDVRPAGTAAWVTASLVWSGLGGDAAVLEVDEPSVLMWSPGAVRWGQVSGRRPVAVTAIGFPPAIDIERPHRPRDTEQFFGQLQPEGSSAGDGSLRLTATSGRPTGDGLSGAALFAGAALVGVLVADPALPSPDRLRAVPVSALAEDRSFVRLLGDADELALTPVVTPTSGFPMLQLP